MCGVVASANCGAGLAIVTFVGGSVVTGRTSMGPARKGLLLTTTVVAAALRFYFRSDPNDIRLSRDVMIALWEELYEATGVGFAEC